MVLLSSERPLHGVGVRLEKSYRSNGNKLRLTQRSCKVLNSSPPDYTGLVSSRSSRTPQPIWDHAIMHCVSTKDRFPFPQAILLISC
jgi:hypothetical protein